VKYVSTGGHAPAVSLDDALLAGLAPDRGLYMPESFPTGPRSEFPSNGSLAEVARALLAPLVDGSVLAPQLESICIDAFNFATPIVPLGDRAFLLELFHGPTAAFKDYGARFLAECLARLRANGADARPLTILVATSGDTGSAVASAFHGCPGFRVVVLYPEGKVSQRQAHQLGCLGDNVLALRVPGSFDLCQSLVKQAFADEELRAAVPLSSANSISLGRLLPQAAYYAFASLRHFDAHGRPLSFIVPTGNLGNGVAALFAKQMGLPISRVLFATNANRTVPEFVETREYRARASVSTLANAMDVGDPSNAARLRYMLAKDPSLEGALVALSVSDETIRDRIRRGELDYGNIFCPHTACAVEMLEHQRRAAAGEDLCVVATAHPAKFESVVEALVGHAVEPPQALAAMLARPTSSEALEPSYDALRARLRGL
jgi:threonine synthase